MTVPLRQPEAPFEIYIENEAQLRAAIARAKGAMEDLTAPLTQVGLMLFKSQRAIFRLKGPGLYQDLSNKGSETRVIRGLGKRATGERPGTAIGGYKLQKLQRWGFIYPILKASGRLERSTTDPRDPEAVMDIVNGDTLYWGTRVPYAWKHQEGVGVPRRPFLIWGADSRYAPDLASYRIGRTLNILNYWALRALGKDIGPTGGEE